MQAERPTQLIDPVCGMTVDVARAEAVGLLLEHEDRTYGFCRNGCRAAFVGDPAEYVARAEAAVTPAPEMLTCTPPRFWSAQNRRTGKSGRSLTMRP